MPNLIRRLEKLEQRREQQDKVSSRLDPRCVCYPQGRIPEVRFPILLEIAFMVKCPLHGDRFNLDSCNRGFIYVSKWLREKREQLIYGRSPSSYASGNLTRRDLACGVRGCMAEQYSGQYRKAHLAAFPPNLWPGVEESGTEAEGYGIYLRLNDGTRIQVSPGNPETMVTMAYLLRERGQIVDASLPNWLKWQTQQEEMMRTRGLAVRCKSRTKAGKACRAAATAGGLCFFHANPDKASELGRIGGRKNRHASAEAGDPLPRLETALAVRQTVDRLIDDVYAGRLHSRVGSGLASLLSLQLRAIETTDHERRIQALEKRDAEAETEP